ncbi:hypothetical protein TCAL_10149, partial [Tigriopus californicus]
MERAGENMSGPFPKTVRDLSDVSTVHGLRYVLNGKACYLDRLLWTLICVTATGIGLFMSAQLWLHWQSNPVVTTIATASLPITNLDFPAITLCSPGNDIESLTKLPLILDGFWTEFWNNSEHEMAFEDMDRTSQGLVLTEFMIQMVPGWPLELTLEEFLLHMTTDHDALIKTFIIAKYLNDPLDKRPAFDILLNPARANEMEQVQSDIKEKVKQLFSAMDFVSEQVHEILLGVLWFTGLPCEKLLQTCVWKGRKIPCSLLFHLIPTDIGFCCSFNHDPLVVMLKNSSFANILQRIENKYQDLGPGAQIRHQKRYINYSFSPQAGKHNGLLVVLDMKSHDLTSTSVMEDFLGIHASVTPKNQFPMMNSNSFLVSPGMETQVEITGKKISATATLRNTLDPTERNCFFTDEYPLQLFSNYTMTNCWMECLMNLSKKALRQHETCIPWNFPTKIEPPCKPISHQLFLEEFNYLDMNKIIGTEVCRPNCGGTEYTTSISSAPFRPCTHANFGLTRFCTLERYGAKPQKWADNVLEQYQEWLEGRDMPDYLLDLQSPQRTTKQDFIFHSEAQTREFPGNYNAFDRDIAVINFFFSHPVAIELISAPSMTWAQYVSSVGGLLGLFIGFSVISGIEILYWFTIGYAENVHADKRIRKISVESSKSQSTQNTSFSAF